MTTKNPETDRKSSARLCNITSYSRNINATLWIIGDTDTSDVCICIEVQEAQPISEPEELFVTSHWTWWKQNHSRQGNVYVIQVGETQTFMPSNPYIKCDIAVHKLQGKAYGKYILRA